MLAYIPVYVFAVLEGEIYYTTACVAASLGKLNWAAVIVAGALGGATGDQLWFYLLRGRLDWLDRYPWLAKHHAIVSARVAAHETPMLLASRFLPGLRVAVSVACAYAKVNPLKFSVLNLVSAFAWASGIMLLVAKVGPQALGAFGVTAWWGPIIPAVLVLIFFRWLARPPAAPPRTP
jgi:membrane protein DedA with SNARE-associated domain